jgi:membrane fusion protein
MPNSLNPPASSRHSVGLPNVRPLPGRILSLGILIAALALLTFASLASYTRKEIVGGYLSMAGGEPRLLAPTSGVITHLAPMGARLARGGIVATIGSDRQTSAGAVASLQSDAALSRLKLLDREIAMAQTQGERQGDALKSRIVQAQATQASALAESKARQSILDIAREALARQQPLVEKGFIAKAQNEQAHQALITLEAASDSAQREVSVAAEQVAVLRGELVALPDKLQIAASEKRRERSTLEGARTDLTAPQGTDVVAPVEAKISALGVTEGDSVRAGDLLAKLDPIGRPLEAVLLVPASAVARVKIGARVHLRLSAFPFQTYGPLEARVRAVDTAPLFSDETALVRGAPGESSVRVFADILPNSAYAALDLSSGMSFTAAVEVENRRIIAWMFWPLIKHFY